MPITVNTSRPALRCVVAALAMLLASCRDKPASAGSGGRMSWPDFRMVTLDGGEAVPADRYKGRVRLFFVWAPWEGTGRYEVETLNRIQERYGGRGFQVLGLVLDGRPPARVAADVRSLQPGFPCFQPKESLPQPLDLLRVLPMKFLVGRDGRIHGRYTGVTPLQLLERDVERLMKTRDETSNASSHNPGGKPS